jgi:hypothetical protein
VIKATDFRWVEPSHPYNSFLHGKSETLFNLLQFSFVLGDLVSIVLAFLHKSLSPAVRFGDFRLYVKRHRFAWSTAGFGTPDLETISIYGTFRHRKRKHNLSLHLDLASMTIWGNPDSRISYNTR